MAKLMKQSDKKLPPKVRGRPYSSVVAWSSTDDTDSDTRHRHCCGQWAYSAVQCSASDSDTLSATRVIIHTTNLHDSFHGSNPQFTVYIFEKTILPEDMVRSRAGTTSLVDPSLNHAHYKPRPLLQYGGQRLFIELNL